MIFLVLAYVARSEAARRHAMHVAMVVALAGIIGTALRLLPALAAGQFARPAVLAQLATTLLLAWYFVKGIKSFRDARRRPAPDRPRPQA